MLTLFTLSSVCCLCVCLPASLRMSCYGVYASLCLFTVSLSLYPTQKSCLSLSLILPFQLYPSSHLLRSILLWTCLPYFNPWPLCRVFNSLCFREWEPLSWVAPKFSIFLNKWARITIHYHFQWLQTHLVRPYAERTSTEITRHEETLTCSEPSHCHFTRCT